ncbi:MAG: methyltransferase domain-containing protein [Bacteroidia bacterium]
MYHVDYQQVIRGPELLRVDSPYQSIVFEKSPRGLALYLDDEVQFVENYERGYHYALAGSALLKQPFAKNVLILGGGDGLAARTVYEHRPSAKVYLAELDPGMIQTCNVFRPMLNLNKGALNKVFPMVGDATATIRRIPDSSMDIVMSDFPDYTLDTMKLYSPSVYMEMARVLRTGGILSVYPGGNEEVVADMVNQGFSHVTWNKTEIGDGLKCHIIQGVKSCF